MNSILRILFFFVMLSHVSYAGSAQDVSSKLETIRESYASDGIKGGDKLRSVGEVKKTIQLYIRGADTNDWATPSIERLKRLGEIADAIQPYTSLLIDLGTPTSTGDGNSNALDLLYFARPTSELKQELLNLANVPSPRGAARAAYDIIFNLGMDTPDVREEIIKRMAEYQPESYKSSAANEIFYAAGAAWRMEETIPFYLEILQSEYRNKNELNGRVRTVANAVRGLGPKAADVLPLLQQQLARMKAENADFRDINVIEGAIRAIEGKEPIEPLLSVNGAGPVGANPLPRSSAPTPAATVAQTTPVPAAATPVQQPKSTATPSPTAETSSSRGFPIVPVAIVVAVIVGIVLYLLRRKST
jgi:hypothetical protein